MRNTIIKTSGKNRCPSCDSESMGDRGGERFCNDCGKIIRNNSIQTQEKRLFNGDKGSNSNDKRFGSKINYNHGDQGMKTKIGNPKERSQSYDPQKYHRMSKWQMRNSGRARTRDNTLAVIREYCSVLNIPRPIKKEVTRIGWKCVEEDIVKGNKREGIASGIIFMVLKEAKYAIPKTDMSETIGVDKKEINKGYKKVRDNLDRDYAPLKASHFIFRFLDKVDVENNHKEKTYNLAKEIDDIVALQSRSRKCLAGACIYLVEKSYTKKGEGASQKVIAKNIGVSPVGLRSSIQDIKKHLNHPCDSIEEFIRNKKINEFENNTEETKENQKENEKENNSESAEKTSKNRENDQKTTPSNQKKEENVRNTRNYSNNLLETERNRTELERKMENWEEIPENIKSKMNDYSKVEVVETDSNGLLDHEPRYILCPFCEEDIIEYYHGIYQCDNCNEITHDRGMVETSYGLEDGIHEISNGFVKKDREEIEKISELELVELTPSENFFDINSITSKDIRNSWVKVKNGLVISFMDTHFHESDGLLVLRSLYTHPRFRNEGHASQLVENWYQNHKQKHPDKISTVKVENFESEEYSSEEFFRNKVDVNFDNIKQDGKTDE